MLSAQNFSDVTCAAGKLFGRCPELIRDGDKQIRQRNAFFVEVEVRAMPEAEVFTTATLPLYGPLRVRRSVSLDSLSALIVNWLPE